MIQTFYRNWDSEEAVKDFLKDFKIDDVPEDIKQLITSTPIKEELPSENDDDAIEVDLDPWIFSVEKEQHEFIQIEMPQPSLYIEGAGQDYENNLTKRWHDFNEERECKEGEECLLDDSIPLPKYFQDLFEQFDELKKFDLKDVIYDRHTQELFMNEVRL